MDMEYKTIVHFDLYDGYHYMGNRVLENQTQVPGVGDLIFIDLKCYKVTQRQFDYSHSSWLMINVRAERHGS